MLTLDLRPAKTGVNLSTRREKHGDENPPAKDLRLKNILLTKEELNEFFDDKHAWDMLYNERKGKPAEPFWAQKLGALPVPGKWRESIASISFGLKPYECTFTDARLSRASLEPQVGGLTAMTLTLSCLKSNIGGDLASLDDYLDAMVTVSLEFGEAADEESDEDEDEDHPQLDLTPKGEIGAPDEERASAKTRDQEIAQRIEADRNNDQPKRGRKSAPTGDALN